MPFITPDNTPEVTARRICIPNSPQWKAVISGALAELTQPYRWQQVDGVTPDEAASAAVEIYYSWLDETCEEVTALAMTPFWSSHRVDPPASGGDIGYTPMFIPFFSEVRYAEENTIEVVNDTTVYLPPGVYAVNYSHVMLTGISMRHWISRSVPSLSLVTAYDQGVFYGIADGHPRIFTGHAVIKTYPGIETYMSVGAVRLTGTGTNLTILGSSSVDPEALYGNITILKVGDE